jgi:hypothetical protein
MWLCNGALCHRVSDTVNEEMPIVPRENALLAESRVRIKDLAKMAQTDC